MANRRPNALFSSAVRTVTNVFWVLYFKLLPSVGLLHAAFIPEAGEVKLEDRDWARATMPRPFPVSWNTVCNKDH